MNKKNLRNLYEKNLDIRMDGGLSDNDIRQQIRKIYAKHTVLEEFQICKNTVVDVGVFAPKALVGLEIKSSFDTVEKLHEQMKDYIKFFHKVEVVTTKHLIDEVKKVLSCQQYARVGIIVATNNEMTGVQLKRVRDSYEYKHTHAHYDHMFNMVGSNSKLKELLPQLRQVWGITGEH